MPRFERPGKRTDPGKLARDRESIERSKRQVAESYLEKPSILNLAVDFVKERITRRRKRSMGIGSAPQRSGAHVVGHKDPDRTA